MSRDNRRQRPNRVRTPKGRSRVGERFEVEIGAVAHGGFCIARLPEPEARVVFVRHVIPGERAVIEITEGNEGDRFWRADAVSITAASPDRVVPPCAISGPGGCGGCDFQHVSGERQRALKADVVAEQLRRLARLDVAVEVEPVPLPGQAGEGLLGWRTRQRYLVGPDGTQAMNKHRSNELVVVEDCLIAHPDAIDPSVARGVRHEVVGEHTFEVEADGFWQVHPAAPGLLSTCVLEMLQPRPGERVLDLFAGVGLFGRFLADAVGPTGQVTLVEGDPKACAHARVNVPGARVLVGDVDRVLRGQRVEPVDLVVLDPPRIGAKRPVVEHVTARHPRAVAYVACDPAALARDVATFAEHGYALAQLRAFDLFPMTSHVEVVALLSKADEPWRTSW